MLQRKHKHTNLVAIKATILAMLSCALNAQNILYNIPLDLTSAPNTASYKRGDRFIATLELDESGLKKTGDEVLSIDNGFISIDFLFIENKRYDESDDPSNGFPRAFYKNGNLISFDYWNSKGLKDGSPNSFFRFFRDGSFQYSPSGANEFNGSYTISPKTVPEPSTSALTLLGFITILSVRRR